MAPHENAESFVDNYMKLLPESDITEFQKVLDMKVFSHNSISVYYQGLYILVYYTLTVVNVQAIEYCMSY